MQEYYPETPLERSQRLSNLRKTVLTELLQKYPDVTFNVHEFGVDVIHYVVNYYDGIRVSKRKRSVHASPFCLDGYFLTEEAAKQAITKHLAGAQAKFEKCLKALNRVQKLLNFDASYAVTGDTHGIEDYPTISFNEGGFYFTFIIRE